MVLVIAKAGLGGLAIFAADLMLGQPFVTIVGSILGNAVSDSLASTEWGGLERLVMMAIPPGYIVGSLLALGYALITAVEQFVRSR